MIHCHINQVKELVLEKIRPEIVEEMIKYIQDSNLNLWGTDQPRNFVSHMVLLTLFKDIEYVGYDKLSSHVNCGYVIGHSSIIHNITLIRKALKKWAKKYIEIGCESDWKAAARHCKFKGDFSSVNLFMDSTDIHIKQTKERGPSSDFWSGKNSCSGWRYMMISDAKGIVRKVWSGYTPKLYDGHFLQANKDYIEEHFYDAHIVADAHFSLGKTTFRHPIFYTNYTITKSKKRDRDQDSDEDDPVATLVKKKEEFNKSHSKVRARVEQPFALIGNRFKSLHNVWMEDLDQLNYLIFYSVAVHNLMKR